MTKQTRALIVDDDAQIRELLCSYLTGFGIQGDGADDGAAMRMAMAKNDYDIVILDLMLPTEDGLLLCRQLRAITNIPIIMLTARGESADRVVGLELGADDYMIKPFDPRELVARIHTILRRTKVEREREDDVPGFGEEVGFEGWTLSRTSRQLTTPQRLVVPLSNAEFRLLWAFIEHPRRVLNRDQLMDLARGRTVEAFDRSIDLLVSRLRQKLNDDPKNPALLKTIRGEGYFFDAKVTR
jgi:two-component system OmpR family response regulator